MSRRRFCPPKLLISIVVIWSVVTGLLYLLQPLTAGLPLWGATLIVVPIAVCLIQLWVMPLAMKLRRGCDK